MCVHTLTTRARTKYFRVNYTLTHTHIQLYAIGGTCCYRSMDYYFHQMRLFTIRWLAGYTKIAWQGSGGAGGGDTKWRVQTSHKTMKLYVALRASDIYLYVYNSNKRAHIRWNAPKKSMILHFMFGAFSWRGKKTPYNTLCGRYNTHTYLRRRMGCVQQCAHCTVHTQPTNSNNSHLAKIVFLMLMAEKQKGFLHRTFVFVIIVSDEFISLYLCSCCWKSMLLSNKMSVDFFRFVFFYIFRKSMKRTLHNNFSDYCQIQTQWTHDVKAYLSEWNSWIHKIRRKNKHYFSQAII